MPQEVGIKGAFMEAVFSSHFKNSGFKLEKVENSVSLTIPHPTKDDEAMYYCGISVMKMIKFSTGTFLAITGNKPHPVTHDLSGTDDPQHQGPDTVELNYAALHFSERNTKKGKKKKKRGRPEDSVYSEVRTFS
ncbi:hypothetical protein MHYP_G00107860 [Metynnis hypsauchen]